MEKLKVILTVVLLGICVNFLAVSCSDDDDSLDIVAGETESEGTESEGTESSAQLKYTYATKEEGIAYLMSYEDYHNGFTQYDLDYRTQKVGGTLEEYMAIIPDNVLEFTDNEKALIDKEMATLDSLLKANGYTLPAIDTITFVKTTQDEECGSGAYTHGTQIFFHQAIPVWLSYDDPYYYDYGVTMLYHEIFHCLTRCNAEFRANMYKIINFTATGTDFEIPASVKAQFISNPDVEHHDAYATFVINGEEVDCFAALIATEPFEEAGDSFFSCMATALVPTDGTDTYYLQADTSNFDDIFGTNTSYVIDPEECMADNFSYALYYGLDYDYSSPEIIEAILDYIKE